MKKNIFYVIFAIANIVFASVLIRYSETGPIASGAYRLILAIPVLAVINFINKKPSPKKRLNKKILFSALFAGIFYALDLAVYNIAVLNTSLAEANLLTNMVPFVIAPISIIFFNEKIPLKFLTTVVLAIIGLTLIIKANGLDKSRLEGDWLALLSAVFYALFLTNIKNAAQHYSVNRAMIITCLSGGIILMLISIAKHEAILPSNWHGWLIIIGMALCGQICGQTLLAYSIKFLPLQLATIFLLLSPVFAAAYAFILFNERLHLTQLIGIIIILAAVYYGKKILEAGNMPALNNKAP